MDPAVLGPLAGVLDNASNYYEFWKEYKGEEILIRDQDISVGGSEAKDRGKIQQSTHVIRGTVKDITSFPPGFLLEDVEEYVELSDASMLFTVGTTEAQHTAEGPEGKEVLRKVDEKYISFGSIEQIERAEVADSAHEPFRD